MRARTHQARAQNNATDEYAHACRKRESQGMARFRPKDVEQQWSRKAYHNKTEPKREREIAEHEVLDRREKHRLGLVRGVNMQRRNRERHKASDLYCNKSRVALCNGRKRSIKWSRHICNIRRKHRKRAAA